MSKTKTPETRTTGLIRVQKMTTEEYRVRLTDAGIAAGWTLEKLADELSSPWSIVLVGGRVIDDGKDLVIARVDVEEDDNDELTGIVEVVEEDGDDYDYDAL